MKRVKSPSGLTLIEILISIALVSVILGVILYAFRNTSSLSKVQNLETEFKQKSISIMQDITLNLTKGYRNNAGIFSPALGLQVPIRVYLIRNIYDVSGQTYDTITFCSANNTRVTGGNVLKRYITYGLMALPNAPPGFKGYALYRAIEEDVQNNTPPQNDETGPLPSPGPERTILIGDYKNKENYIAVSKLDFQLKGNDLVNVCLQLVGVASRGGGTTVQALYRPDKGECYTTSVQMSITTNQ